MCIRDRESVSWQYRQPAAKYPAAPGLLTGRKACTRRKSPGAEASDIQSRTDPADTRFSEYVLGLILTYRIHPFAAAGMSPSTHSILQFTAPFAKTLLSAASQLIFAHGVALPSCISGSRFLCEHKSASRNAGVNCKNSIHQHGQKEQEKVKSCKNRGKYAIIKMISSFL